MDHEAPHAGSTLAERYELGSLLGQGGMGTVREATDQRLGRRVAVKILRADLAEQTRARSRFETEARAAARLVHPNVVTVFDSGEADDVPFLVMERLPGRTFADELAAGPVAIDRVLAVVREILAALAAAHSAGIIHRDIKPGNVLLTEDGHAKVSDFGIAKTLDDADQTQTIEVLATPAYLAPERLVGEPASERSDLYSVGVLLYEALSGIRPFRGDTPVALLRAIEHGAAEPLLAVRPEVPPELAALVERSMAVDPEQRFSSADAMATALETATVSLSPADLDETVVIHPDARAGTTQVCPFRSRSRPKRWSRPAPEECEPMRSRSVSARYSPRSSSRSRSARATRPVRPARPLRRRAPHRAPRRRPCPPPRSRRPRSR